jgi:hypothetical protein
MGWNIASMAQGDTTKKGDARKDKARRYNVYVRICMNVVGRMNPQPASKNRINPQPAKIVWQFCAFCFATSVQIGLLNVRRVIGDNSGGRCDNSSCVAASCRERLSVGSGAAQVIQS